jgi:hypothetical protein
MSTIPHISKGRIREAEAIARRIPQVLQQRGLQPLFQGWVLTEYHNLIWLFGAVDLRQVKRLEQYRHPDLLHHLSTAIGGRPVYVSNSNGLRYAVLLSPPPRLPRKADFPGLQRGKVLLGQRYSGQHLGTSWPNMRHLLVAGMTGSGKSTFLRLIAYQGLAAGHQLLLADMENITFPMLADHPALLAPIAQDKESMLEIVERGLGECEHRSTLYGQLAGFPEKLEEYNALATQEGEEPLPRLLVILDEFNAATLASGGAGGPLASAVAELGWRGRKYGINMLFAAQDFTKAIVGRVRDQVSAAICFRVRNRDTARNVGCPDAVRIPESRPGLAFTDRWGPLQAFYLPKEHLIEIGARRVAQPALTSAEMALVREALNREQGRVTQAFLEAHGMGQREARRLLEEWRVRGWLRKDPEQGNAHTITEKLRGLADKVTNPTKHDKPDKPRQTQERDTAACRGRETIPAGCKDKPLRKKGEECDA